MANNLGIVHPKLVTSLPGFYPSSCEVQRGTESRDGAGQVTRTWATLAGHGAIPCAVTTRSRSGEVRTGEQEFVQADFRIALAGHYPTVTEADRAIVGAVTYNVLRVRHDQMSETTYLDCEVVT